MALKEYLGAIILEIDGKEYEIESCKPDHNSGRTMVKTMNRTGRPSGYAEGVHEWTLQITAPIPVNDALDWDTIKGAKLTIFPVTQNGKRTTYQDCVSLKDSEEYGTQGEAKVSVTLAAANRIKE